MATAAPLLFNGIPVMGADTVGDTVLQAMARSAQECGKALVIIQLAGGNDGLNTVFPLDQWDNLQAARSNIIMAENQVLTLENNDNTALHPAMTGMRNLYNEGKLMIMQGVSYPNPSFSHFRSTDIWSSASGSDQNLDTGWLGRMLDLVYPGFPAAYPNATMPHPLAVQIGSALPFTLQGPNLNMGYNTSNPDDLINIINNITDPAPNNDYGNELTFIRLMKTQSNVYANSIKAAYSVTQSQAAVYPLGNNLAEQLRIVARLINGGLQTPIYIVKHHRTFDTHEYQVDVDDRTQGPHADNLRFLSEAISAFQQDLEYMGKDQLVTGMTVSEFGRRILSNASFGTDHGTAAPVFLFGAALNTNSTMNSVPGMLGSSPVIPQNVTVSTQVDMQFDFRQIYTTIMQDWLCMTQPEAETILGGSFEKLSIFQDLSVLPIELLSFTAEAKGSVAKLNWVTATELNNYKFEIERSDNAVDFNKIGQVMGAGTVNTPQYYQFTDTTPKDGVNYYRLKQIDFDGKFEYSQIVSVYFDANSRISVFPNPARHQVIVTLTDNLKDARIMMYNAFGQLVLEKTLPAGNERLELDISHLPKGSYFVRIQADQTLLTQQLVKG